MEIMLINGIKGSPVYEVPANTGSQGNIYCMQSYPILQEAILVIRTRDHQGIQQ